MSRPFTRLRALFFATLLGAGAFSPARAADMLDYPEPLPPPDEPVEWGSNWYLRGDVAWQQVRGPALSGELGATAKTQNLLSGGIGGGYQFNDWLRADLTIDRTVFNKKALIGAQIWCPYQVIGITTTNADGSVTSEGILANPNDTCSQYAAASLTRTSGLANVYLDLVHVWGLTPYVGAGLGMSYNSGSSSLAYLRNTDGALWAPDLTLPDGQVPRWIYGSRDAGGKIVYYPTQLPFGPTNWNSTASTSSWTFAWNVMAGVSYDVSKNLKVDVGYRYLNAGKYTGLASWGSYAVPVSRDITSQELRVGVRIVAN
jgi:opacity protein-like surface antigen